MARNKSISTESLPRSSTIASANNRVSYTSSKQVKLHNNINIKIVSELVRQPDISSLALSKKLDIPLSTLQRRRARIEKAILKKTYTFNYKGFGGRIGDLIVNVDKGKSDQVAQSIIKIIKIMLNIAILELIQCIVFWGILFTRTPKSCII
jgi:hypothetical protein